MAGAPQDQGGPALELAPRSASGSRGSSPHHLSDGGLTTPGVTAAPARAWCAPQVHVDLRCSGRMDSLRRACEVAAGLATGVPDGQPNASGLGRSQPRWRSSWNGPWPAAAKTSQALARPCRWAVVRETAWVRWSIDLQRNRQTDSPDRYVAGSPCCPRPTVGQGLLIAPEPAARP